MKSLLKYLLGIYTLIVASFVYLPIMILVIFSFNKGERMSLPLELYTTKWYLSPEKDAHGWSIGWIHDQHITGALFRSIELAILTMLVVVLLGTLVGLAYRYSFPGKEVSFNVYLLGLITPGVLLGLGNAFLFDALNVRYSLFSALPVHVIWTLPWGVLLIRALTDPNILTYESAARTLGASNFEVLKSITFPLMLPVIMSMGIFAFTLSFDEVIRTVFVVYPNTLPPEILGLIQQRTTPKLYSLGASTTFISLTLLIIVGFILSKSERKIF
jgi:putative spermidine/putrescine transport system permease protein